MSGLNINALKCDLCLTCVKKCPFEALSQNGERIEVNAGCKMCGICVRQCPKGAIRLDVRKKPEVERGNWRDILVFVEGNAHGVHPITFELIGKALELAGKIKQDVHCVYIGEGIEKNADELLYYGLKRIFVYDNSIYRYFSAEPYADAFEDCIRELRPSIVLVGATAIGRSLAPRLSTRFQTGLTADCTQLEVKENTDLIQIRPAFGGNIMARIVTPYTRPQFATVRYKVMDRAKSISCIHGDIERRHVNNTTPSRLTVLGSVEKHMAENISDADVLVAAGRGLKSSKDLSLLEELAHRLGAQLACSRPLVEAGWMPYTQQIGLSGRTVKPKLIIACGISGAVQFTSCMKAADCIISINSDENAPILKVAHYGIVGDLYEVVPKLCQKLKGGMSV